jgi:hypothetical protein
VFGRDGDTANTPNTSDCLDGSLTAYLVAEPDRRLLLTAAPSGHIRRRT